MYANKSVLLGGSWGDLQGLFGLFDSCKDFLDDLETAVMTLWLWEQLQGLLGDLETAERESLGPGTAAGTLWSF